MVIVSNYLARENEQGEKFFVLIVDGEAEVIQSKTGKFYVSNRKATLPTTFSEEIAKSMIGKKLPGKVIKEACEPYPYEVNGETIQLSYTYKYSNEQTVEETLFEEEL